MTKNTITKEHKVIDFFSGRPLAEIAQERIIRLAPENDGLCMLYSNDNNPDRYFAMRILCWGLRWNGDVVGMVPWMNKLVACPDIQDPANGYWEGYYDPEIDHVFDEAPMHKVVELETAVAYFETHLSENQKPIVQEIPDNIGTHALLLGDDQKTLTLTEVISWQLDNEGMITGKLINPDKVESTPVLPGDKCLYPATENPQFRYYFQHHIANQIKNQDPEALSAIAELIEGR